MKLYRKSGLTEELLTFLGGLEATKDIVSDINTFVDTVDKDIMKAVDTLVDTTIQAAEGWEATVKTQAKKAVREGIQKTVDVILSTMEDKLAGVFSINDFLDMLTKEEDIAALKTTSFTADPGQFRLRKDKEQKPVIYATTVAGMDDAVFNYNNAPRGVNSTFVTMFMAFPVGLNRYLANELGKISKLIGDPIFKGVGLNSLEENGLMETCKKLGDHYAEEAENILWKERSYNVEGPILKRNRFLNKTFTREEYAEAINSYDWEIECGMQPNPLIPFKNEQRFMLRLCVLGADTGGDLKIRKMTSDGYYGFADSVYPPTSTVDNKNAVLFPTKLVGGMSRTAVRMDLIKDAFDADTPFEVFDVIKENELAVFVEYWRYNTNELGGIVLTELADMRYVAMDPQIKESGEVWYGLSVGGLGSVIPGLDEIVKQLRSYINEFIKSLIKTDRLIQTAINDTFALIMAIIRRFAKVMYKLIQLLVNMLRVMLALDIRYAIFYGSFTDIPKIWLMIRSDYRLVESMGNFVWALVMNVKGDWYPEVSVKLDEKLDQAQKLIGKAKPDILGIPTDDEQGLFTGQDGSSDAEAFNSPVFPVGRRNPFVETEKPVVYKIGVMSQEVLNSIGISSSVSGGPTRIQIPEYA